MEIFVRHKDRNKALRKREKGGILQPVQLLLSKRVDKQWVISTFYIISSLMVSILEENVYCPIACIILTDSQGLLKYRILRSKEIMNVIERCGMELPRSDSLSVAELYQR